MYLFIYLFIYLYFKREYIPSIATLFRAFIIKRCWVLSKAYSIYWDDYVIFIFYFVYVLYYFNWFAYVEQSLHSWKEINLLMVYGLFSMLLNWMQKSLFVVVLDRGTLWHLQKFLQHIKYIIFEFTPQPSSLSLTLLISWIVLIGSFSISIHIYTVFALYSPSHTLSPPSPPPTGTNLPRQDLFCTPVLWFC
jgi:hypothetical protein